MALTQQNRQLQLKTPLGEDTLLLTGFEGREELSRLFSYRLEMLSDRDSIDPAQLVGLNVTFSVNRSSDQPRYFNGHVRSLAALERPSGLRKYAAEIVPWLWFLTQTTDCRIFQHKNIPDIVEEVFSDLGFNDFEFDLQKTHPEWEYCVQYRETDFNFVSRLLEQEGIFYYFEHSDGKHQLVLADHKGAYRDCQEAEVEYEYTYQDLAREDRLTSWRHEYKFTPGKRAQTDYNFIQHPARNEKTPAKLLHSQTDTLVKLPDIEKYEMFDYPGEYEVKPDGQDDTSYRMQEDETGHDVVTAGGTLKSFTPGGKFKLKKHDSKAETGKGYVITSIEHAAIEPAEYHSADGAVQDYSNKFTAIPDQVIFRPERSTEKPRIHGAQTAVVTGPPGEEIWPDEYGRVKVQFYWDRVGERDENTTCWIRCMQSQAGKGWGTMFIPRIGQEVVVSYLEGDPDRPLITGLVYNADQMPAYKLPDEKTKSYIKTNSTLGGEGYNEVRFEDKKDEEQIFIHAERNMDVRVKNDSMTRILNNRHQIIGWEKDGQKGGDQREQVFQDKHLNIKRHQVEHIEGNFQLMIGNGDAQDGGNMAVVVEKQTRIDIGDAGLHTNIGGNQNTNVGANQSLTVGQDQQITVGSKHALDAGQEIHLKAGMNVVMEAGANLTIKGAGGFIKIGPEGVTIQGMVVKINSGGAAGRGSGANPEEPAAADQAGPTDPDPADNSETGQKSAPDF